MTHEDDSFFESLREGRVEELECIKKELSEEKVKVAYLKSELQTEDGQRYADIFKKKYEETKALARELLEEYKTEYFFNHGVNYNSIIKKAEEMLREDK
jgi:hypothetical protein